MNNQMTARGTVNYIYDAAGNLASDGTRIFTWDALGRLKQVQQGNQTVATYGYDIQNRRFRKTVGSITTYYLYNLDDQLIAEISGSGTVLREYVWLDGEPFLLAEYTGTSAGMYFYVNDHLGTPQQLLNGDTGAVAWQAAYLPFGEAQVQVSMVTNNLRFPGQYYDAETGLHYNWNRYYDPKSGRYISADPVGLEGGLNLYIYVENNIINNIDHMGLSWHYDRVCMASCVGDATLSLGLSLIPGFKFVKESFLYMGVKFNPFQRMAGVDDEIIGVTAIGTTAAVASGIYLYKKSSYEVIGGDARRNRLNDLSNRRSFSRQSYKKQRKILDTLARLNKLRPVVSSLGAISFGLSVLDYINDIKICHDKCKRCYGDAIDKTSI